ncbi:MAG TPA: hypothetical protein DDW50_11025 [Firmicutes bacterium]|jgi:multiple sugar transport system substrate-binding protein|nr:hypothetical protein [Bacillota bacterium]
MLKRTGFISLMLLLLLSFLIPVGSFAQDNKLVFVVSAGGSGRTLTAAAREFEKKYNVKIEVLSYPWAEARDKQILDLSSGAGSIDIISVEHDWVGLMYHFLVPLDADTKQNKDLIPSILDGFRYAGPKEGNKKLYAVPARIGTWILYYRKDLLQQKNIKAPETFADLSADAKSLTDGKTFGLVMPLKQSVFIVSQWLGFLWSNGGELLDANRQKVLFTNKRGIEATQYLVNLYRNQKVVSPESIEYEHDDLITALQQGRAAMAVTYSPYVTEVSDPAKSKFANEFAWSSHPYNPKYAKEGHPLIAGWGVGVNKSSKNIKLAKQFVQFVGSSDIQLMLALNNQNDPTVASVYKNDKFKKLSPAADAVLKALEGGKWDPSFPEWPRIQDALSVELSNAFSGKKTVEAALDDAKKDVDSILGWREK